MSYLNLYDADAAWRCVHDLGDRPAVVIVKHANPCGVAIADDLADAYQRAYDCDSRSAFGGIVALNKPVDAATVERIVAAAQADLDHRPGLRRGRRRVAHRPPQEHPRALGPGARRRSRSSCARSAAGFLVQDAHAFVATRADWRVVTRSASRPTPSGPTPSWRGASSAG